MGYIAALAARFYGWSWEDIGAMPMRVLVRFVALIPKLEARERLGEAITASFPHLDKKARNQLHKAWLAAAGFASAEQEKEARMTMQELRERLKGQPLEGVLDVATMTIKKPPAEK